MSEINTDDLCHKCGEPLDTCSNCGHRGCTGCDPEWAKLPDWLFYCPECKNGKKTTK